jgi:hypothetical protein
MARRCNRSAIESFIYLTLMKQTVRLAMVNGVSLTGIYKPREDRPTVPAALAHTERPCSDTPHASVGHAAAGREAREVSCALPELR